jgi:hypothetical protein
MKTVAARPEQNNPSLKPVKYPARALGLPQLFSAIAPGNSRLQLTLKALHGFNCHFCNATG